MAGDSRIAHLLRRAGFGASAQELESYEGLTLRNAVDQLVSYEDTPDDVDSWIGQPGYAGITARGPFSPNTLITDARQRWVFRMVHSQRPLQEKMTLFWHHHFATGYLKIQGVYGAVEATRMMAARPSEDPFRVQGQIDLFREQALGNFGDLLLAVAKDPAMVVWLDGRLNTRARPQENFGREIMELFTMGVGFHTEADVYAAARVFTGWNLARAGGREDLQGAWEFFYNAAQHETTAKTFSFPIYENGSPTIPARSAADGMQDGIDLIKALVRHPETGRRLARKLWDFFISEMTPPDPAFVDDLGNVFAITGGNMRMVMRRLLLSPQFHDPAHHYARYAWPIEYVVRALKEVGPVGFSVNDTLTPLLNMGQILFEPPDVSGWNTGTAWMSTGSMLARMNFGSALATNQRVNLANAARPYGATADATFSYVMDRLTAAPYDRDPYDNLRAYLTANGAWTGTDAQLRIKVPGLVHLILGSAEYQFN
jgi:uncharacterized protein (DUF1800 family)